ncbi:MAG: ABC transporter permease, partial [Deltaproteobacteria bacterium]|nr:ABC transporter permease [Deltaproteobacteria bacterium]
MLVTLLIGLRNLKRRRLRTILTGLMIFGGTTLLVFSIGLAEGTYAKMTDLATRTFTGHFQVMAQGYHQKPSLFKTVVEPEKVRQALAQRPQVKAVSARVETAGLLSAGTRTTGVQLIGVDPQTEPQVTTLAGSVKQGSWFGPGSKDQDRWPIIIGAGVAKRLKIKLGAEVSFVGQAADGSIAAELFRVAGIVESGAEELDSGLALVRLRDAQELLVLGQRVHRLVGLVGDLDQLPALKAGLTLAQGDVVLDWAQILPELKQSISADRAGQYVFLFIVLGVVLLGVTNTMTMAVLERSREFGVMLAI